MPFAAAQATARSSTSDATTRAPGRSALNTLAIAPDPVHKSIATPVAGRRSTARCASGSLCQRGTYTPGSTRISSPQKETCPTIQASGSPVRRRRTSESRSSASPPARARRSSASSSAETNPAPERSSASACTCRLYLSSEAAGDVAEHVLHLVAENDQDDDHDHRDQDQDQCIFDHALPLVSGKSTQRSPEQTLQFHELHLYNVAGRPDRLGNGGSFLLRHSQGLHWQGSTRDL